MSATSLESRIAFIRDLAQRGGFGSTLAARDAVLIIELALRELLRRGQAKLPDDKQREVWQAIANAAKGTGKKGLEDLTLGQLVGVIRETGFFDAWSVATGKPLIALRLIDLNALTQFRNKELNNKNLERLTDPAAQVSPADVQFLLHCVDVIVTTFFGILSLEDIPPGENPKPL